MMLGLGDDRGCGERGGGGGGVDLNLRTILVHIG